MTEVSPPASRLVTPRWLDGRLITGVVMVLLAVVAGARLFASADHFTEVYVARGALVPGEHLSAGDVTVGRIRFDGEGARYVAAGTPPIGYVVSRYVAAGELIPLDAVAASPNAVTTTRFVTLPVDAGHAPADLGHGDLVDVYATTKSSSSKASAPRVVLRQVPVETADNDTGSLSGSTATTVALAVPDAAVSRVIAAMESGSIDLVRVPAAVVESAPAPATSRPPS